MSVPEKDDAPRGGKVETMAKDEKNGARNFGVFLAQMEEGQFQHDLSAELQRANQELSLHAERNGSAKGQIAIIVNLKHQANGTVDVVGEIKTKLPKSNRSRSVFWTLGDGNLSEKNPKQGSLPFREVNADSPAKDIASPTRVVKEVGNG